MTGCWSSAASSVVMTSALTIAVHTASPPRIPQLRSADTAPSRTSAAPSHSMPVSREIMPLRSMTLTPTMPVDAMLATRCAARARTSGEKWRRSERMRPDCSSASASSCFSSAAVGTPSAAAPGAAIGFRRLDPSLRFGFAALPTIAR
jgi:hypothetical protein